MVAMRYLLSLLLVAAACVAAPDPIYVSTSGHNTNAGTIDAPYRTIAKGFEMLQPGGTLYLRGGTYQEWGITPSASISGPSESSRTRIASYPGERAIFQITGSRSHGISGLHTRYFSNLVFDGWTIDYGLKDVEVASTTAWCNIKMYWVTNLTFTNMHFLNNTNGQLTQISITPTNQLLRGTGGNILVTSCLFSNVALKPLSSGHTHDPTHFIYWSTLSAVTIENNVFADGLGKTYGIQLYGGRRATNWVVRNNYFTNVNNGATFHAYEPKIYNNIWVDVHSRGIGLGNTSLLRPLFANNVLYNSSRVGGGTYSLGINNEVTDGVFVNNIVWGNWRHGIWTDLSRTTYYTNNTVTSVSFNGGTQYESGTLLTDPLFLSAPTDLRISSTSPARATGIDLSSVFTTDYNLNTRTAPWDRGAYMFNSAPGDQEPPDPDPEPLPLLSVSASGEAFEQGTVPATFTVSRAGSTDGNLNVAFAMSGTAASNVNYTLSHPSPITINNAESTATITLTPVDLGTIGLLDATITLLPDAAYTLSSVTNAMIEIYGSGREQDEFRRVFGGGATMRRSGL